jgi:hypothetical protein
MRFSGRAAVVLAERGVRHHIAHMLADAGPLRHDHRGLGALYDLPACRLAPWRLRQPVVARLRTAAIGSWPGAEQVAAQTRVRVLAGSKRGRVEPQGDEVLERAPGMAQYIAEPSAAGIRISRPAPKVPPLRSRMLDAKIQLMFDYGRHHQVSFADRRFR